MIPAGMRYQGPIVLRDDAAPPPSVPTKRPTFKDARRPRGSTLHSDAGKRSTLSLYVCGRWLDLKVGQ